MTFLWNSWGWWGHVNSHDTYFIVNFINTFNWYDLIYQLWKHMWSHIPFFLVTLLGSQCLPCAEVSRGSFLFPDVSVYHFFFLDSVILEIGLPQDIPIHYWRDTNADAGSRTGQMVPLCGTPKITTQHLSFLLSPSHQHRWTRDFHSTALLTSLCQWERILIGVILIHLNSSHKLQLSNIRH